VFFVLVARVLVVFHLGVEVELVADLGDGLGEFDDGHGPRHLIVDVDPVVAGVALLDESNQTLDGVFETHHRLALFTLPVHRDRVPGHGLCTEPIDDGPEVVVEVEPRRALVRLRLRRLGPIHDRGPHLAHREVELRLREPHVRRIERLRVTTPNWIPIPSNEYQPSIDSTAVYCPLVVLSVERISTLVRL